MGMGSDEILWDFRELLRDNRDLRAQLAACNRTRSDELRQHESDLAEAHQGDEVTDLSVDGRARVSSDGTFDDYIESRLDRIERALFALSEELVRFDTFEREPFMTPGLANRMRRALADWENR
jgi:hypothetical protein